jgi:hypothetical protein
VVEVGQVCDLFDICANLKMPQECRERETPFAWFDFVRVRKAFKLIAFF